MTASFFDVLIVDADTVTFLATIFPDLRVYLIVAALAAKYGAAFVPLQDAIDEAVAKRGPVVVAPDNVHPSPMGHQLIARLWLGAYDRLG